MNNISGTQNTPTHKIIIFDGICGLCNSSVNILIKLDKQKLFQYTSLQGEFVKTLEIQANIDSIIFYNNGSLYYKSTAILEILKSLGGIWALINVLYIIPRVVRDTIYDIIARYRYNIFGKRESCRMPNVGEEKLFLD